MKLTIGSLSAMRAEYRDWWNPYDQPDEAPAEPDHTERDLQRREEREQEFENNEREP